MEALRPLSERSLEELLWQTISARVEGLVVMRDRDGLRHGVWVHNGFVVGVHVAGRFDPLLDRLRKHGALDVHSYRACVEALWRSSSRSGAIAMEVGGIARPLVRDTLRAQAVERMCALFEIAHSRGHDAAFEARDVPAAEMSVRMPLGALLRHAPLGTPQQPQAADKADARRRLRELAKRLHPDRNAHLDPATRRRLELDLAHATAAYHGFA